MFGKSYNTVGSTESNFLIKTCGDLKVQQGNRFIDIIKDGKMASEKSNIFFQVEVPEQIQENGIYLVGEKQIWICINGVKIALSN